MTTAALTLANFNGKFFGIQQYVTPVVLDLINKSETMKAQIRSYQGDENTQMVVLDTEKPGAASYTVPVPAIGNDEPKLGFATFGVNRLSTPEDFIRTVSHELGHYAVENPGAVISNARANTAAARDVAGYAAACQLTEGYARLATARVIDEIRAQSSMSGTLGSLVNMAEYVQYQSLVPGAASASWTASDLTNALAFGLGEFNKTNFTSTSGGQETYIQLCSRSANEVISAGSRAPAGSAPATVFSDEVDSQWSSGGNKVDGFSTYTRTDGTVGMSADVELGYTGPGWQSSVAGNLVRLTQGGGLSFGMAQGNALNIDVNASGLSGAVGSAGGDTLSTTGSQGVMLQGDAGNDVLTGGAGDDWLSGGTGADSLNGGAGDDTLLIDAEDSQAGLNGGAGFDIAVVTGAAGVTLDLGPANLEAAIGGTGNDVLSNSGYGRVILAGGAGNDVLKGGRGDDVLEGGAGNDQLSDLADGSDTYLFSRGDGQDTIEDKSLSGADKLVLQNIASGECTFSRKGLDLTLGFGQGDQITVRNYYDASKSYQIERVEFSDGVVWTARELAIVLLQGASGNDSLGSTQFQERDIYVGGKGNDALTDTSGGNDIYMFARGDGQDTIMEEGMGVNDDRIVLQGISSTEALLSRAGQDLILGLGQNDQITVKNYFSSFGWNKVEHAEFADGVVWDGVQMNAAAIRGTAGNDSLSGGNLSENNTYIDGKGNDTLTDSLGGNDCYVFARGDGQDTIIDSGMGSADDRISLTDIKSTEATLSRTGQDLLIVLGATDRITVRNHFDFLGTGKIERLQFADGVEWGSAKLDAAAPAASASPVLVPVLVPVVPVISIAPLKPVTAIVPITPFTIAPIIIAPIAPIVLAPVVVPPILSLPSPPSLVGIGSSVQSGTDYVLGAAEQNLTLTGTAAINGTGNALANTLSGNAGNNTLTGGAGSDTYLAYRGMGQDRAVENDATPGNTDVLSFGTGIAANQLWFSHTGNDLAISIIGTADKMTAQNWYLGNPYHVEQIKAGDGKVLQDTQVDALVQAMAGFAPPAMGQTTLAGSLQTSLAPVLAANWH